MQTCRTSDCFRPALNWREILRKIGPRHDTDRSVVAQLVARSWSRASYSLVRRRVPGSAECVYIYVFAVHQAQPQAASRSQEKTVARTSRMVEFFLQFLRDITLDEHDTDYRQS